MFNIQNNGMNYKDRVFGFEINFIPMKKLWDKRNTIQLSAAKTLLPLVRSVAAVAYTFNVAMYRCVCEWYTCRPVGDTTNPHQRQDDIIILLLVAIVSNIVLVTCLIRLNIDIYKKKIMKNITKHSCLTKLI